MTAGWKAHSIALAIGLVVSELVCRAFFSSPFAEQSIATGILFHPRWGAIHEPGARYRQQDAFGSVDFEVSINSQGFRNREIGPKRLDTTRVVVMGDSFTEGFGVAADEGFVFVAESIFRERHPDVPLEIVNAGIRGGSPSTYRRQLDRILALEPDGIIVTVFDNDLWDDFVYRFRINKIRADMYARIPRVLRGVRLVELMAEMASHVQEWRARAEAQALIGGGTLESSERRYGTGRIQEDPIGFYASAEAVEAFLPHWAHTRGHLREIVAATRAAGVEIALFHIPAPQTGIHGDCCSLLYPDPPVLPSGAYGALQAWLAEFAASEGVPFVELASTFLRLEAEDDKEPVYLIPNGHLNARGNRLAAELLQGVLEAWSAQSARKPTAAESERGDEMQAIGGADMKRTAAVPASFHTAAA